MTTYGLWLITERAKDAFATVVPPDAAQFIPCVAMDGTRLLLLHTLHLIDCFDPERSVGVVFHSGALNPWREGKIKWAVKWRIDPAKVGDSHIFRVKNDDMKLIVSDLSQPLALGTPKARTLSRGQR